MRNKMALVVFIAVAVSAVLPAVAAPGDNSVGMNIHVGRTAFLDACADLGVGWVRMDANWFVLEPTADDDYRFSEMEGWVLEANARGLRVFLTLAYTPSWVPRRADSDGVTTNDCPQQPTEWVDFVTDFVAHFSAPPYNVTHYGIWNEPNLSGFFDGSVDDYVNVILLPGTQAVRAACPSCLVLGPELAHVGDVDDYLEQVLARVPLQTFDIITHHIYQDFVETGCLPYGLGGDCFENALEFQRFPFTRRSLRQVLDAAGWSGEVWITETGYRADPGNAGEEQNQATYVTRALEEQLARAWYTNSFFYEILDCQPDQPECGIDGFGLMRAVSGSPGSRSFPDDYRLKPAFAALRDFIDAHPEITGQAEPPACGDGRDNDGDGRIDLADRGCTDAIDDDESDDPPRRRLGAWRTPGITVDGDAADFGPDGWAEMSGEDWHGFEPLAGPDDLAVRVAARWDPASGLYLFVQVSDDVHANDQPAELLWQSDSLQVALDVGAQGGDGYDADDHELGFALSGSGTVSYRFQGTPAGLAGVTARAVRQGQVTGYEVALAPEALPGVVLAAGRLLRFSFLVNDDDGGGRAGWLEWTPGIGVSKQPEWFGEIELRDEQSPGGDEDGGEIDGGDGGASDGGSDAGVDGGGEDGGDAAADAGADDGAGDAGVDAGGDWAGADQPDAGDHGADAGDREPDAAGSSCGCGTGRGGPLALLLVPALVVRRRRRR